MNQVSAVHFKLQMKALVVSEESQAALQTFFIKTEGICRAKSSAALTLRTSEEMLNANRGCTLIKKVRLRGYHYWEIKHMTWRELN